MKARAKEGGSETTWKAPLTHSLPLPQGLDSVFALKLKHAFLEVFIIFTVTTMKSGQLF